MLDIFKNDAFSVINLTAAINEIDHVPGRAGELAFVGVGAGVTTDVVAIESKADALTLIQTKERGAPSSQQEGQKRKLRNLTIPHIPLDDTVRADEIQGVRQFGSDNEMQGVQSVINGRQAILAGRHDLTLENHRLGALKGEIKDADGSTLMNLFTEFGVTQEAEVDFELDDATTEVRTKCSTVIRKMKTNAKMALPGTARVWAFCSDEFFDALISHANVKGVYDGYAAAERRLGQSYVHGVFEYGGIFFENYQGSDDGTSVGIDADKVRFFWNNAPGMYIERYAPGDFLETVNTVGLPMYSKLGMDPSGFNRFVNLHTQQNPLPLCLRPRTLMRGKRA